MSERVRVLVVDDSALMRKLIPTILERDPSIEVIGTAMDGAFALKKIEELHPDVITLDLEMPRMDGIETLRLIMRRAPMPVRSRIQASLVSIPNSFTRSSLVTFRTGR